MDTRQVDIISDAVLFQETLDKLKKMQMEGTTAEVMAGESIQGIDDIIKSIAEKQRVGGKKKSQDVQELPESEREQEVRQIMQRFNIKMTRDMVHDYSQRGTIQCNQNQKAFFDYKKSKLFMKKDDLLQEELDKERKHLISQIVVLMEKIENDKLDKGMRGSKSSHMSPKKG